MSVAIPRSPSRATFAHARRQSSTLPPRQLPPSYSVAPLPHAPSHRAPAPIYSANDKPDGETRFVKADRTRMWITQQTTPVPPETMLQSYGYPTEISGVTRSYATPPASPSAAATTFPGYAFAMPDSGSRRYTENSRDDHPVVDSMPGGVMGRALARSMADDSKPKRGKSATAGLPKGKSGMLRFLGKKDTNANVEENTSSFMDMSRR